MKHAAGTLLFIARFAVLGLAMAFVVGLFWPGSGERLRERFGLTAPPAQHASQGHVGNGPVSYADAVAAAAPSVVNIYANKIVTEQAVRMYDNPVLQQLFGGQPTTFQHREQTLGSGVIVSAQGQGYVLTNNHVIAHAADIQVLLYDGRIAKASLVGADEESDLAVLKIEASNLPVIHIAEQPLRPGDVVLAIGNPLGLNQTVTMGIVSAIGRQLNGSSAEDFIQTDAAINLGNSGGALVNAEGELVGINTLLIGKAAGAEGIGFAIPVTTAKKVLDQIIATGHVVRGWLGADYAFVPVAANGGLPAAARGALVTVVYPGSPAALAGIRPRDILLSIGTDDILDPADLRRHEAALKPGSKVQVSGLRNGNPFHVEVTLAQRPAMSASAELDN
ncbi:MULTISPECIES: trypsin-like peptidase domain-containing protein [unclassified Rhodanobacter]|jgi:serine peptidase DegS|uniref:S1C family serine protease n=1 Tax=unclassified Rhodanobacter TaxID=2621553 RepID=UPI001BDFFCFC|nr:MULTISPECIES: trypsin-like peptidase domain-containing protein [unclassified Rhodanobacter]MBT2145192.1 trypsin-like peptidase domain-containing protein [Rhodanobacter sp. LX-99]MBT2149237.1 trypsin-like peptidase domain-containing protein [Rhodanobacter sp. LX-100]